MQHLPKTNIFDFFLLNAHFEYNHIYDHKLVYNLRYNNLLNVKTKKKIFFFFLVIKKILSVSVMIVVIT